MRLITPLLCDQRDTALKTTRLVSSKVPSWSGHHRIQYACQKSLSSTGLNVETDFCIVSFSRFPLHIWVFVFVIPLYRRSLSITRNIRGDTMTQAVLVRVSYCRSTHLHLISTLATGEHLYKTRHTSSTPHCWWGGTFSHISKYTATKPRSQQESKATKIQLLRPSHPSSLFS